MEAISDRLLAALPPPRTFSELRQLTDALPCGESTETWAAVTGEAYRTIGLGAIAEAGCHRFADSEAAAVGAFWHEGVLPELLRPGVLYWRMKPELGVDQQGGPTHDDLDETGEPTTIAASSPYRWVFIVRARLLVSTTAPRL